MVRSETTISTTFRVPSDLLKATQHQCIDRGITQQQAIIEALTLWADADRAWSGTHAVLSPDEACLLECVRDGQRRGVQVDNVLTFVSWLCAANDDAKAHVDTLTMCKALMASMRELSKRVASCVATAAGETHGEPATGVVGARLVRNRKV